VWSCSTVAGVVISCCLLCVNATLPSIGVYGSFFAIFAREPRNLPTSLGIQSTGFSSK
jgi:hypothetical protein